MQCAVIEYGRNVIELDGAHSSEFDKDTRHPVICLLDEQQNVTQMGGTMRLGSQETRLDRHSIAGKAYDSETIHERHRHRYEFNNQYRQQFEANGMRFAGTSPDGGLVEIVEIPDHPWFVAVQFHPEFKSKPLHAHPLFAGFVEAAIQRHARRTDSEQSAVTQRQ
jgi:CTP synthase